MTSLAFWLLLAAFVGIAVGFSWLVILLKRAACAGYDGWAAEQRDIEAWRLRVARRRMREVDDAMRQTGRR